MTHGLKSGERLVVASHNRGKVWEINQLIAPFGLEAVSAGDMGLPEPDETEPTFEGNAKLKALSAAKASGLPALADDSGLEVDVLGGAPGIFSARWAGPTKDFSIAMERLAGEIAAREGWTDAGPRANFISVIAIAWPDGETRTFEGKVFGHLVWPPRGGNGFGYDPMFVADGEAMTFGEMEPAQKYAISHRTRAFRAFKAAVLQGLEQRSSDQFAPTSRPRLDVWTGLRAAAANLSTRAELTRFIANLRAEIDASADDEAALDLALSRIEGYLASSQVEDEPKWRLLAKAILAAAGRD